MHNNTFHKLVSDINRETVFYSDTPDIKIKYGACALHVELLGLQTPTVTPYLFLFHVENCCMNVCQYHRLCTSTVDRTFLKKHSAEVTRSLNQ